jgi:hypothetical protein
MTLPTGAERSRIRHANAPEIRPDVRLHAAQNIEYATARCLRAPLWVE